MAAYNWIVFKDLCPSCQSQVDLRCQTHVASDYDGDDCGRFHDAEYALGERMRWWPEPHKEYKKWRIANENDTSAKGEVDAECCYVSCPACGADLYAVIEFDGPCPQRIKAIGLESNWPANYKK